MMYIGEGMCAFFQTKLKILTKLEDKGEKEEKTKHVLTRSVAQCYKTFYIRNLRSFGISQSLFQPILMFVSNAKSLPKSGTPESYFTRVGSGLTSKIWTRLDWKGLPVTNTFTYNETS